MYTYKVYIRPILEYSCVLFAHANHDLLKKIRSIETQAIKIAYQLPPWTTNHWCYSFVNFTPILDRLKDQAKNFLDKNKKDDLIEPLIDTAKPSMIAHHSPIFKALHW